MQRLVIVLLVAPTLPALTQPHDAEHVWRTGTAVTLFDGGSLAEWQMEMVPADPYAHRPHATVIDSLPLTTERAIRLVPSLGWIHTKATYRDFRLTLMFRAGEASSASLYFRTWQRLDKIGMPANGYEVVLGSGAPPRVTGRILAHGRSARISERIDSPQSRGETVNTWQHLALEVRSGDAGVFIDEQPVLGVTGLENPVGFIGLRGEAGHVDVRDIVLTPMHRDPVRKLAGLRPKDIAGVAMPKLKREVKPAYTAEAMRERIRGAVLLEALIGEDGAVREIAVLDSLDPTYGLDNEAVRAARQWRFEPARKDGKPVQVVVSIEMTFTLK
jgi:TonB family protein